jgi:hypothetical protein
VVFAAGLCAILIAAVAVSVASVPDDPLDFAFENSVEQALDELPLTQAARMLATKLTANCGAVPLPAGVVASAAPVATFAKFPAFANAFATPTCASAVPELETCVASVANPASA